MTLRQRMLFEATAVMGEVPCDDLDWRSLRLFIDRWCSLYKALPDPEHVTLARELVESLKFDEKQNGGLLSTDSIAIRDRLDLAMGAGEPPYVEPASG